MYMKETKKKISIIHLTYLVECVIINQSRETIKSKEFFMKEKISREMAERAFVVLKDAITLCADEDGYLEHDKFHDYIEKALDVYYSSIEV